MLPDYVAPGLRILFCGTAVGRESARRGHYYAGPGNDFWTFLHESGLTPVPLTPEQDARVLEFGLGLTDLAKQVAASKDADLREDYDVSGFVSTVERLTPRWIAFHGKEAAKVISEALGHGRDVRLGVQPWRVSGACVFVLPSASGSNRDASRLEGRPSRVEWFRELRERAAVPRGWPEIESLLARLARSGASFPTITGKPNRIVAYEPGERVVVETETGVNSVQVRDIRACWDTFERKRRIRRDDVLDPGRRSAFMMAIFRQVPGVREEGDRPRYLVLG